MSEPSFFSELKRRHVVRAAIAYAVVAWVVLQIASIVFPSFGAPEWVLKVMIAVLALAFPVAIVLAWAYELTPEGIRRTEPAHSPEARAPEDHQRVGRHLNRIIIGVMGLVIVLLLVDRFLPRRDGGDAQRSEKSIAVLPLVNTSADPANEYFSDGMSEELINTLGKVRDLTVIGRNSSFQFKGKNEDTKVVAAKLGVAYVVEGSVRKAEDRVRIVVQLVKAATGANVWSETYDRELKDIFAVQSEIATAVAGELRSTLLGVGSGAAVVQPDMPPSSNVAAYNAYLQGKFYYGRGTEADSRKAIEQFTEATRLDPGYAQAFAWLSRAWSGLAGQHLTGEAVIQGYAEARRAVDTAMSLAPDLALAHVARGYLKVRGELDWRGAEIEFRRAMELAPESGEAVFQLGSLQAALGQTERAVESTRKALGTDPLNARWHSWLGAYLTGLGRLDEAEAAARKAIELQPGASFFHVIIATLAILRGDADAALAAAQTEPPGIWRDIALALAQQIGPDRGAADAALQLLIDKYSDGFAYQVAEVYALRNDADNTFSWLDRAWDTRDAGLGSLHYDVFLTRFRADPRFSAFCRKVGLPTPVEVAAELAKEKATT